MGTFLLILLLLVGMFMILVVMLQRGRGGGLVGALGGQGGHSAFGTRAGDLFTWITIGTACVWVLLACGAGWRLRYENERFAGRSGTTDAPLPGADSKKGEPPPIPSQETPPAGTKTSPGKTLPAEKPEETPKTTPAKKSAAPAETPAVSTEPEPKAPASEAPATEKPASEKPATETPPEPAKPE
jgi:preprotein translocase subunit SecG